MIKKNVSVTATLGTDGVEWDIDGYEPKKSQIPFPNKSGPCEVDFDFDDRTKSALRFDCSSPLWINENTAGACPPPGVDTDQIEVLECSPDKLTIVNKNDGCARILHYQLNFVDPAGHRIHVDPEFKNGGSK